MGATPRFGIRWPELTDAPNGPAEFEALAEDVEGWLCRAFPCLSSARPTSVPDSFLIRETDTGNLGVWTGSAWALYAPAGAGSGGGGGTGTAPTGVPGQWSAGSAQSIPFNTNTVIAFGTTNQASALVTRATQNAGHKFTVSQTGTYAVDATVRFSSGGAGGNRYLALHAADDSARYAAIGNDGGPGASTLHLSVVRRFAAGAALTVIGAQSQTGGGALSLEPTSAGAPTTGWVQISITLVAG